MNKRGQPTLALDVSVRSDAVSQKYWCTTDAGQDRLPLTNRSIEVHQKHKHDKSVNTSH